MVYLIHLEKKFHNTQHYIGFSYDEKVFGRIDHHLKNSGSRYLRAVNLAGIAWKVVRVWPGEDGNFERKLKNYKKASCFCPVCNTHNKKLIDEKAAEIIKQLQRRSNSIRKSGKRRIGNT